MKKFNHWFGGLKEEDLAFHCFRNNYLIVFIKFKLILKNFLGSLMKVQLFVSKDFEDSHAEIYTDILTDNIQKAMVLLEDETKEDGIDENNSILAVKKGKDIVLLDLEDIFMFRVEDKQLKVYTDKKEYLIKKPLYQIEDSLDSNFIRISKTTIVNIRKIERVAPSLKGMMFISLKNGLKDNISRKYLPDFKNALGLWLLLESSLWLFYVYVLNG